MHIGGISQGIGDTISLPACPAMRRQSGRGNSSEEGIEGVRSQESGVRSQESGVSSQQSAVSSQQSAVSSQQSAVSSQQSAVSSQLKPQASGSVVRYQALGLIADA